MRLLRFYSLEIGFDRGLQGKLKRVKIVEQPMVVRIFVGSFQNGKSMSPDILPELLKVGGIGALATGIIYSLFRRPIKNLVFPTLETQQAYVIILSILFAVWSIAMVAVLLNPSKILESRTSDSTSHIPRRFVYSAGSFERIGLQWIEHTAYPNVTFSFFQDGVSGGYVHLVDPSRVKNGNDPGRPYTVRLPLTGGWAQWSYPNPYIWTNLYFVHVED